MKTQKRRTPTPDPISPRAPQRSRLVPKRTFRDLLNPQNEMVGPNTVRELPTKQTIQREKDPETETRFSEPEPELVVVDVKSTEKPNDVSRPNDVRSITPNIVQKVVVIDQAVETADVLLTLNVSGAPLRVRVKQAKRGLDIRLSSKDTHLRRGLRDQKTELVEALEHAGVVVRNLRIR